MMHILFPIIAATFKKQAQKLFQAEAKKWHLALPDKSSIPKVRERLMFVDSLLLCDIVVSYLGNSQDDIGRV